MGKFSKSTNITGKYKDICIINGHFVEVETGFIVPLISELEQVYGSDPFSISTSAKYDNSIALEEEKDDEGGEVD